MNRFLLIAFLLLIIFFGCKKNDLIVEKPVEIYYTYQNAKAQHVSGNDTIAVNIGDSLFVYVELNKDVYVGLDSAKLFVSNNISAKRNEDNKYLCIAKEAGLGTITTLLFGSELPSGLEDYLFVNIVPNTYLFLVVQDPTYIINVKGESLNAKIRSDLKDVPSPKFYNLYILTGNTTNSGSLQLITAQKDTITGNFTSSNTFNMTDMTMHYNNSTYNFTIEQKENDTEYYYLKQDITEEFRTKYPNEIIDEVIIKTLIVVSKQ